MTETAKQVLYTFSSVFVSICFVYIDLCHKVKKKKSQALQKILCKQFCIIQRK